MNACAETGWVRANAFGEGIVGANRCFAAARALVLLGVLGAPLGFGAVEAWAWATACITYATAFTLWCVGCVLRGEIELELSYVHALPVALLIIGSVQLALGRTVDPIGTREVVFKLLGMLMLVVVSGTVARGSRLERLGVIVTVYVLLMSVFALVQYMSAPGFLYWVKEPSSGGAVFGSYVNHNHFAGLMEILLPITAGSYFALSRERGFRSITLLAIVAGVTAVFMSGSRGGGVAVLIETAAFVYLIVRKRLVSRVRMLLVTIAILAAGLGVISWLDSGEILDRWRAEMLNHELAAGPRLAVAKDAVRMFTRNPVRGVGLGAFEVAYPHYQTLVTDATVDHAHNDYLEMLAETGVIGVVLLLAGGVVLGRTLRRCASEVKCAAGWIRAGSAIACLGFAIHGVVDFNFHIPANSYWFALAGVIATARDAVSAEARIS